MPTKLTTAEFVDKARAVHGDKYGYELAVYGGDKQKLVIVCREHGPFEQRPDSHLAGQGCAKCAGMIVTTAAFIARAREVHGDRYNYSKTVYVSARKMLTIICPKHGVFKQAAKNHTSGRGCNNCHLDKLSAQYTTSDFIEKAQAVHGVGAYDYSQAVYINSHRNLQIHCPQHGLFWQQPHVHLKGAGCKHCSNESLRAQRLHTTSDFIEKAQAVHGVGAYDYSQAVYLGAKKPILIRCPQHGLFEQAAGGHISGKQGCSFCEKEHRRLGWVSLAGNRTCYLYFIRIYDDNESFFKVGITSHTIAKRLNNKGLRSNYHYEILALHQSANAAAVYDWEQSILETFAHLRYRPQKHFVGETECFASCEEILEIFPL